MITRISGPWPSNKKFSSPYTKIGGTLEAVARVIQGGGNLMALLNLTEQEQLLEKSLVAFRKCEGLYVKALMKLSEVERIYNAAITLQGSSVVIPGTLLGELRAVLDEK